MRSVSWIGIAAVVAAVSGYLLPRADDYTVHEFERMHLSDEFFAEGAGIGDLNGDGIPDVASGPYWYEGPDYERRHEFYSPEPFDPLKYSDNFIVHVYDFNGDDWNDILIVGFPGEEAHWYENPQGEGGHWKRHLAFDGVDNESPHIGDVTGDGRPDLVFHHDGYAGYATADGERPTEPWTFQRISTKGDRGPFTHGFGVGDVSGNGHPDVLMADGWWENPGPSSEDTLWRHHPADFGRGGAQMYAYDVDGDGYSDVITSLSAHEWGIAWFRQSRHDEEIRFEQRLIMGERIEDNPYGVRFSQPHAVALVDMDGDGLKDVVSGKRYWAHGPDGDPEPNAPAVLYWFRLVRSDDGNATFVPYLIDDDSGAGVHLAVDDLTGDGYPDVAVANKKGTFVFHQHVQHVDRTAWENAQPRLRTDAD